MRPYYTLSIDDSPIDLHDRAISMQVIDKNGMEADQLTIEIDDHDGQVAIPARGRHVALEFGYIGGGKYFATFVVDEVTHTGPPDTLRIVASSADFRHSLLEEREISYHDTTVGGIISEIAGRGGLSPAVGGSIASIAVQHLDQTNESDANLVTRLADEHHAIATVKDGQLIFVPRVTGIARGGHAHIERQQTSHHDYSDADRDGRVTGVVAYYQDKKTGKRKQAQSGGDGYRRHLKQTYNSADEALVAAEGQLKQIKARARELSLTLTSGRPDLYAEMPLTTNGFKPDIDTVNWIITEITHTLNSSGLITHIDAHEHSG